MPLSTLQSRIARTLTALPEARDFALAGGGALVTLGIVERPTEDLDYFATAPDDVDRLRPALEQALADAGLAVTVRRAVPGFVQLMISDGASTTALDLAWDARLDPPQPSSLGPVLATDEVAADKTLALFGRAAARVFVDVFHLLAIYPRHELLRLAARARTRDARRPGSARRSLGSTTASAPTSQSTTSGTPLCGPSTSTGSASSPPDRCHHD